MKVKVLFFARARDLAGQAALEVDLPAGGTVADLRRHLAERLPALAPLLAHSRFAIAQEFAADHEKLLAHAEVALLPPVSGG